MTLTSPRPAAVEPPSSRRRRWLLLAGVLLPAALLAAFAVVTGPGGDAGGPASPAATTAPPPAAEATVPPAPPTPEPTGPTEDVDEPPPSLPDVALDEEATAGNGIVGSVTRIEAIEGTAVGPGNIAGPALRVTVRIENGSDAAVSLAAVAVNASYGSDRTPASPLDDPSQRPFTGTVDPGEAAEGVYVFTVPADQRELVTVDVGYQAGAPLLLFTGAAP